jgi:hypothetical protein
MLWVSLFIALLAPPLFPLPPKFTVLQYAFRASASRLVLPPHSQHVLLKVGAFEKNDQLSYCQLAG